MLKYVIKRLLLLIPILLAVSFIVFALMTMTGDPVRQLMGEEATEADIEAKREELGYNDPVVVRYANYMWPSSQLSSPLLPHFLWASSRPSSKTP